ncbi:uncharacterized protein PF3D7_1120000-like isoform X3 [Periplaneta americana]|uniref:uncharacterized protein PF3D7_1120000-like isoform X3 n=1 Tax=Periplaneta americana TaxID=6978 RepID=UPI0037E92938
MDVIKAELEVDPLSLETSDDTDVDEKKLILEERNLLDQDVTGIKEEYVNQSHDLKSEIKFEVDPTPVSFPVVKREPEEVQSDFNEDPRVEVTVEDEVFVERMAKPNPISDLKQRVKTLEGQVRLLLPLIEIPQDEIDHSIFRLLDVDNRAVLPMNTFIVRVLKERLDSRALHGLEARKEEEKVGSSNNIEELKEKLKLRERELRETQGELEKLKEESEREKVELRQKYEEEHQLRLQQEETYQQQLRKLRQELQAEREMRHQLEENNEEALRALREELQAKGGGE